MATGGGEEASACFIRSLLADYAGFNFMLGKIYFHLRFLFASPKERMFLLVEKNAKKHSPVYTLQRKLLKVDVLSGAVHQAHREREQEEARRSERLSWNNKDVNMCLVLTVPDTLYKPKKMR